MSLSKLLDDNASDLLHLVGDNMVAPLLVLDRRGCCVYLNKSAEEFTGYRLAEMVGRSVHELIHHTRPDGSPYPRSECPIERALVAGLQKGEDYFVRKDGKFRLSTYTASPIEDENVTTGAVVEFHPSAVAAGPRTDQRSVPTVQEGDLYKALLSSMEQGFFVCEVILDGSGKPIDYEFVETNPSFERLTGLHNAKGKTARQLVPDLEPHWFEIYGGVALSGEPIHISEGSAVMGRWFDVYAFRVGAPGTMRVAALFTDVTERKRAEEERDKLLKVLELERSRLQTVFQDAPAAIATLRGKDHVFEMANPLYMQLVRKSELLGKAARDVFPELKDEGIFELLDHVYETGESFVARGRHVPIRHDSDDQQRDYYLDFVYQPLREADGTVSGIFAHAVDVTEHKQAVEALAKAHDLMEQRVEERTAELKALNSELESFNYSVSHDLRAPLRAIDGFTQLLMQEHESSLDSEGQRYLRRIRAAGGRMGELIDDLLKLSQLTRADMKRRQFDLSELSHEVVTDILDRKPRDPRPLIIIAKGMTAVGDPALLRIALENLLENSFKFTQKRSAGRIEIGVSEHEKEEIFYVRDNGAGFSMDQSQKLFVPFQRLHSEHEYSGSGIGLATVQRIIHKHGGRIWAEGKPDGGATFYFTLASRGGRKSPSAPS